MIRRPLTKIDIGVPDDLEEFRRNSAVPIPCMDPVSQAYCLANQDANKNAEIANETRKTGQWSD